MGGPPAPDLAPDRRPTHLGLESAKEAVTKAAKVVITRRPKLAVTKAPASPLHGDPQAPSPVSAARRRRGGVRAVVRALGEEIRETLAVIRHTSVPFWTGVLILFGALALAGLLPLGRSPSTCSASPSPSSGSSSCRPTAWPGRSAGTTSWRSGTGKESW